MFAAALVRLKRADRQWSLTASIRVQILKMTNQPEILATRERKFGGKMDLNLRRHRLHPAHPRRHSQLTPSLLISPRIVVLTILRSLPRPGRQTSSHKDRARGQTLNLRHAPVRVRARRFPLKHMRRGAAGWTPPGRFATLQHGAAVRSPFVSQQQGKGSALFCPAPNPKQTQRALTNGAPDPPG